MKAYQEGFDKANPTSRSSGCATRPAIVTAKLLAEKANPKADVVMGLAATSLAIFAKEGMLLPYAPAGLNRIAPQYRDPKNPPSWVGMDVWGATICFNTAEAAKRNIPKPETWKDLTKPVYKGQIVMPHPASSRHRASSTSSAWLQIWGEAEGWKFMDGLHENIAQYMHSGSRPCAAAANGEYVVGISFEYRANREKAQGKPIDLVFPKEGLGWDLEAIGIHKGTKNMAAAQKLLDWAVSDDGDGAVRQQLRDRRGARAVQAAAQRAGRLREPPGEERFRVGGEEPRQDPRRVVEALRVQGRAEVSRWPRAQPRGHDSPGCSRPAAAGPGVLLG